MSIQSEIERIEALKKRLRTWLETEGGCTDILNGRNFDLENLIILLEMVEMSTDADTVDGWHVAVRDDGSAPPSGTTGTITFVYGG